MYIRNMLAAVTKACKFLFLPAHFDETVSMIKAAEAADSASVGSAIHDTEGYQNIIVTAADTVRKRERIISRFSSDDAHFDMLLIPVKKESPDRI